MKKSFTTNLAFLGITLIALVITSCKTKTEQLTSQMMNASGDTISKGTYVTLEHETRGNAAILKQTDGGRIVQFYNYYSTPAPNIDIFLSKTKGYTTAAECPRLGDLTSIGSFNYPVPAGINSDDYPYVVSYCVDYSAVMGYALLKKLN
jgi:hypothetical protein